MISQVFIKSIHGFFHYLSFISEKGRVEYLLCCALNQSYIRRASFVGYDTSVLHAFNLSLETKVGARLISHTHS